MDLDFEIPWNGRKVVFCPPPAFRVIIVEESRRGERGRIPQGRGGVREGRGCMHSHAP